MSFVTLLGSLRWAIYYKIKYHYICNTSFAASGKAVFDDHLDPVERSLTSLESESEEQTTLISSLQNSNNQFEQHQSSSSLPIQYVDQETYEHQGTQTADHSEQALRNITKNSHQLFVETPYACGWQFPCDMVPLVGAKLSKQEQGKFQTPRPNKIVQLQETSNVQNNVQGMH